MSFYYERCCYCERRIAGRVIETRGEQSRTLPLCMKHLDDWMEKRQEERMAEESKHIEHITPSEFLVMQRNGWIAEDGSVTPAGRAAIWNGDPRADNWQYVADLQEEANNG